MYSGLCKTTVNKLWLQKCLIILSNIIVVVVKKDINIKLISEEDGAGDLGVYGLAVVEVKI